MHSMVIRPHPVFDNPLRMGYVEGWRDLEDIIQRLGDLGRAIGDGRVVPARWEPGYRECPCSRYAELYKWGEEQLLDPASAAVSLALVSWEGGRGADGIARANYRILCAKSEPSQVTRELVIREALEVWEGHASGWLERVVEVCARLNIFILAEELHLRVLEALRPLLRLASGGSGRRVCDGGRQGAFEAGGFDRGLMQVEGWTPDPGFIILPVDGGSHAFRREILRLDLKNVVLFQARRTVRVVAWEKVMDVHISEGGLVFEVMDGPRLIVRGYREPEAVLGIVQGCYKAATERELQVLPGELSARSLEWRRGVVV